MGCFFTCFRFRDDDRLRGAPLDSSPGSGKRSSRDKFISRNQLASLFLYEEEDSLCEGNLGQDGIDKDLKREAKLLKACGAISETPIEIRKASKKTNMHVEVENESSLKSQPKISGGSSKKHEWDEQTPGITVSPLMEDGRNLSACNSVRSACRIEQLESKKSISLSSLLSDHQDIDSSGTFGSAPVEDAKDHQATDSNSECSPVDTCTHQVNSHREIDPSSESVSKFNSLNMSNLQVVFEGKFPVCNNSPFPTPLKLSDGMQTPGTVYPTNMENSLLGGHAQVRTQYVYPVPNYIKDISQSKTVSDSATLIPDRDRGAHVQNISEMQLPPLHESHKTSNQFPLDGNCQCSSADAAKLENIETPFNGSRKWESAQDTSAVVESLSQWLKPPVPENESSKKWEGPNKEISEFDRDRPIIGTVAAHWNEDELPHISPKWWDGNGIPNSTNKYKEDQKVSWHATPFEERLEKALSEEHVFPERKLKAKPITFEDEDAESDTAAS